MENQQNKKNSKKLFLYIIIFFLFVMIVSLTTYAFFNYTRTGPSNTLLTSQIKFNFVDSAALSIGNAYPIEYSDIDNKLTSTFTIQSHTTLSNGLRYKVYAVAGDEETGKTRLLDSVMSLEFIPAADADGFTTMINNYSTPKSPQFTNGKALISTGLIKDTNELTTKTYTVKLWIDSSKIYVSSTTKRETNAEGNPSLADTTSGTVSEGRYIKNDNNLVTTNLYPATSEQEEKIIYTTKEFYDSYYSIKIEIEAEEVKEDKVLVYFDANGGEVNIATKEVTVGEEYDTLPRPYREGYTFLGWNGKNLFNPQTFYDIGKDYGVDIDNNDIILTTGAYQENNTKMELELKENFQYCLSYNWNLISIKNGSYIRTGIGYQYTDGTRTALGSQETLYATNSITSGSVSVKSISDKTIQYIQSVGWAYSGVCRLSNIQLEEGSTATSYEPYYVTDSVTVTQEKDHALKAIWQKNS